MTKVKVKLRKPVTAQCLEKIRVMYLLLGGNDTVPISMWRSGDMRYTDY